jgi:hypothetical protein
MMPEPTGLERAFISGRISEAVETYARGDAALTEGRPRREPVRKERCVLQPWEWEFWEAIKRLGDEAWGHEVYLYDCALSEWVARAPGLYWEAHARALRELVPARTVMLGDRWRTFDPPGKSMKVSGGIGTMRLPPASDGWRLCTLTCSLNASAGVPTLVSPEVWEAHGLHEGVVIQHGLAQWQPMGGPWSARFPMLRGLPRGYLILDEPSNLSVFQWERGPPVQIHPFTVMEYYSGAALFYDYVYATTSTGEDGYRQHLAAFFDAYRQAEGRDGAYLLSADVSDPLWEARYESPEHLRSAERAGHASLQLLEARVQEHTQGTDIVEALVKALAAVDAPTTLVRISEEAGIPSGRWHAGGPLAEEAARLVSHALRAQKQRELIDAYVAAVPGALVSSADRGAADEDD